MGVVVELLLLVVIGAVPPAHPFPITNIDDHCGCVHVDTAHVSCTCTGHSLPAVPSQLWTNATRLIMRRTGVSRIGPGDFRHYPRLTQIEIVESDELSSVHADAFATLTGLKKLVISDCPKLERLDGYFLRNNPALLTLEIRRTALATVPKMRMIRVSLTPPAVDLSENQIGMIESGSVENVSLSLLRFSHNGVESVADYAFRNSKIYLLRLDHNPLMDLADHAFSAMTALTKLDLSYSGLGSLPERGLDLVEQLSVEHTPGLKRLPPLAVFSSLKLARLTYPYHCCLFQYAAGRMDRKRNGNIHGGDLGSLRTKYCSSSAHRHARTPSKLDSFGLFGVFYEDEEEHEMEENGDVWEERPVWIPPVVVPCVDGQRPMDHQYNSSVQCWPQPDPLNPCEDVMVGWPLRVLVFLVWMAAVLGNGLVLMVLLLAGHPRRPVNNFLMANLAVADLCTGVYLAMLGVEDVSTRGEYYNYAVEWQTGWGCKVAGALSVFGGQLSVLTMLLIAFEVWYNTKYAIFQKRVRLWWVVRLEGACWLLAAVTSALPLLGVSDYSATSTCLPLRVRNALDRAYLIGCLTLNALAFGLIVFCYVSVYCAVSGSMAATARAQDLALAKLMFCLIFTDFLCWAPTILFGLTAAMRAPLIGVSLAKVFLVIFYPLNACANPWLYVLLTKRFRMDMARWGRRHGWLGGRGRTTGAQPANGTSHRSSPSTSSTLATPRGSCNDALALLHQPHKFRPQMSDIIESSNSVDERT